MNYIYKTWLLFYMYFSHDFIAFVPLSLMRDPNDAKCYFWSHAFGKMFIELTFWMKTQQTPTVKSEAAAHIHATGTRNIMHPSVALHWLCNFSWFLDAIVVARYKEQPADVSIWIAHMRAVITWCCLPSLWTAAFIVELMPGKSSLMYFG